VKKTVNPSWTNIPSNSERLASRTRNTLAAAAASVMSATTPPRLLPGRDGRNSSSSRSMAPALSAMTAPRAHQSTAIKVGG
jgi:hypothetical protein